MRMSRKLGTGVRESVSEKRDKTEKERGDGGGDGM